MYHAFGERDENDRYVVPRRSFARQLRLLRLLGYRSMRFEELVDDLRESRLPPRRAVVITIDDGYRDNLEMAAPLLRRYGYAATVFLVSQRVDGVNDWTSEGPLAGRPLLSWAEVEQLASDGISIGAHTRTHPALPTLGEEAMEAEVSGSREDLKARLGRPIRVFAYPYGELDESAVRAVAAAGFSGACTVEARIAGLDEDLLRVPRITVRAGESVSRFLVHLWLGLR
jgi:peptidoglycan/xylan/chitin deacetylase (PgdA/CDA1 family)